MYDYRRIVVVVTARGGSKGLPLKNVKEILGKPLFLWSVEAALQSKYVDRVFVSSNCKEVYKKFSEYHCSLYNMDEVTGDKLKFIQRPDELSTDTSKNEEALIHMVHWARDIFREEYNIVINLQPTSPCRLDGLLDRCIEKYYETYSDSLLTATRSTPFFWRKKGDKWYYEVDKNDCCNRKMRQDFREDEFVFHDCGSIFITDTNVLLKTNCRIGKNPYVFEVEGINSFQIDTEFDFQLIENMSKLYSLKSLI